VLITSKRDGNTSRVQMTHIGIRPEEFSIICCKGVNSPIAAYEPLTPGAANGECSQYPVAVGLRRSLRSYIHQLTLPDVQEGSFSATLLVSRRPTWTRLSTFDEFLCIRLRQIYNTKQVCNLRRSRRKLPSRGSELNGPLQPINLPALFQ
jgi:hypothetical protein